MSDARADAHGERLLLWAGDHIGTQWDKQYEYRFAIQNLEPVPIDRSMRIKIIEEGIPPEWRDLGVQQGPRAIRVYSGRTTPIFVKTRTMLDGEAQDAFCTELKFGPMLGNDTWTVKVRSKARNVKITLVPAGAPLRRINPLKPWLGITLTASELEIGEDTTSPVRNGPSELPTKATGVAVAAIGPVLYVFMMILMWLFDPADLHKLSWFPLVDFLSLAALGLIGWIWYRWVRRAVYPTIQSYHRYYWAKDREQHEEKDADIFDPAENVMNDSTNAQGNTSQDSRL